MRDFPQNVIVVTGAGSGIGRAAARRLSETLPVVAIGRSPEKLEALQAELRDKVIPWPMDVSARPAVHMLRNKLTASGTTVSALINNAGFARSGAAELPLDALEENWDAVLATNLTGAFQMSMALAPLIKRPGGRIVNISSIAAYSGGRNKGSAIYAASKAGLHGLSAGLAREFSDQGITVNCIAPGLIGGTEFTGVLAAGPRSMRSSPRSRSAGPVRPRRSPQPLPILCSAEAGFITGEVINQNGGFRFGG